MLLGASLIPTNHDRCRLVADFLCHNRTGSSRDHLDTGQFAESLVASFLCPRDSDEFFQLLDDDLVV